MNIGGYTGKILRVDLSNDETSIVELDQATIEKWVGGVGFGAKYLYEEVPAGIEWSDPDNRIIWTSGPLAGSGVYGAGTFNVTSKGPMTNLAGCSQANGYFGAYMKFSGRHQNWSTYGSRTERPKFGTPATLLAKMYGKWKMP